jgi:hypothetical protein
MTKAQRQQPRKNQLQKLAMVSFLLVLRGLTRELTHTAAVAARRETAARFTFDNHVISW